MQKIYREEHARMNALHAKYGTDNGYLLLIGNESDCAIIGNGSRLIRVGKVEHIALMTPTQIVNATLNGQVTKRADFLKFGEWITATDPTASVFQERHIEREFTGHYYAALARALGYEFVGIGGALTTPNTIGATHVLYGIRDTMEYIVDDILCAELDAINAGKPVRSAGINPLAWVVEYL